MRYPRGGFVCHFRDEVPNAVYIGRSMPAQGIPGSMYGNPFKIEGRSDEERRAVLVKYADHLIRDPHKLSTLQALRDKPLACWCRGFRYDRPLCHGDVILEFLRMFRSDEILVEVANAVKMGAEKIMWTKGGELRLLAIGDVGLAVLEEIDPAEDGDRGG